MTVADLARLTRRLCPGGGWDRVEPLRADSRFGLCECGYHPLSAEWADRMNTLLAALWAEGGPPPATVYLHCADTLVAEWMGPSPTGFPRVVVDWSPGRGWAVMEADPSGAARFHDTEDFP